MGNVSVKYKGNRGSHAEGDPVTDPKEFVQTVLDTDYARFQGIFNEQTDEVKAAIDALFVDEENDPVNVFESTHFAKMWTDEQNDDTDYAGIQQKILGLIAQN